MDVDRAVAGRAPRRRASSSGVTARRLCGATPTTAPSSIANRASRLASKQPGEALEIVDESPLAVVRRRAAEAGMRIEHRQQRQPDAGLASRRGDPLGHLGDVGIGLPVAVVVQIVELADAGEAGLQHLDIELRGDRLDLVRRHRQREAVHHLAPAPEAVGRTGRAFRPDPPCRAGRRGCAGSASPGTRIARRSSPGCARSVGSTRVIAPVDRDAHIDAQPSGSSAWFAKSGHGAPAVKRDGSPPVRDSPAGRMGYQALSFKRHSRRQTACNVFQYVYT